MLLLSDLLVIACRGDFQGLRKITAQVDIVAFKTKKWAFEKNWHSFDS